MAAQGTPPDAAQTTGDQARTELNRRVFRASHSRIPEIVEPARKIRRHGPDILRTTELGCSNARLEASDNRIKVTIRMAYGFHHANNPHRPRSCSAAADSTYAHHNQEPNPRKQQKPHMYWTFLRREGGVTAALRCENARLRSWALTVEPAIMAQATIATRRY